MRKIADIPKNDRPREKLQQKGPQALSDIELLAVLIGSGTKGNDVMSVAKRVLTVLDGKNEKVSFNSITEIEGVGLAKATLIVAALELARRRIRPEGIKITFPQDVLPLIANYVDRKQEHFICISINGANEVIACRVVSVGLVNKTQVHPREVYADPVTDRAAAIIVAHNHPAGDLTPSDEDIKMTQNLKQAGDVLGIKLLDHIIISKKGHYSFKSEGLIE